MIRKHSSYVESGIIIWEPVVFNVDRSKADLTPGSLVRNTLNESQITRLGIVVEVQLHGWGRHGRHVVILWNEFPT